MRCAECAHVGSDWKTENTEGPAEAGRHGGPAKAGHYKRRARSADGRDDWHDRVRFPGWDGADDLHQLLGLNHFLLEETFGELLEDPAMAAKDLSGGLVRVGEDSLHFRVDHQRGLFRIVPALLDERDLEERAQIAEELANVSAALAHSLAQLKVKRRNRPGA